MSRPIAIFAAIVCALTMSQFMRAALSVVAPDVMAEAHLTPEAYGSMAGAFFLGVAVVQIPTGILFDRFGPRVTIACMQLVAATGTVLFALSDNFATLFVSRFVTGIGFASALMGGLVVAARWFRPDRFSQVTGLLIACSGAIGLLSAATPMAWLSGLVGWRWAFVIAAGLTVLTAALIWLVVRDAPPGHPWHARGPEGFGDILQGYRTILRLPGLPVVMLMAGVGYPTMITLIGVWGGPYLHDVHGLAGLARGNVLTALVGGSVLGLLIYGPLDRWVDSRKYVVIGGVALSVVVLALLALLPHPPVALVALLFAAYGVVGSYYITNITLGRAHYPDHLVGRGVTIVNLCTFIGVVTVQFATAFLMGHFAGATPGAPAPELAYRILFGALALYGLVIGAFYFRARDVKPSAQRVPAQAADSQG